MHRIADDFGGTQSALQGDRCKACGLGLIAQDNILGRPLMNTPASKTTGASIKFGPAIPGPVGDTDSGRGFAASRWASDHEQRCMSSEHFGQLAWQFKRMSGSSGLKVQAVIAC